MQASIEIVPLHAAQSAAAGELLAQAFAADAFTNAIVSDAAERLRLFSWYFGACVRASLFHQAAFGTAGALDGVAVWGAPGAELTAAQRQQCGLDRTQAMLGEPLYTRYRQIVDHFKLLEQTTMPTPHWYLSILGVAQARQGQGIGGALLAPVLARADADGVPCYLETLAPQNISFYQRHGFEIATAGALPHSQLPFWTFQRIPRLAR